MPEGARGDRRLLAAVAATGVVLDLFDLLPEVVFFVKDDRGRYAWVNHPLVRRLGRRRTEDVLGRTTVELFAPPLGDRYLAQDLEVCRSGRPLEDLLELHIDPDGSEGWCITDKRPVRASDGRILGLVGISRDIRAGVSDRESLADLAEAVRRIHEGYGGPLRVEELAEVAGMSSYQLGRRIRALFGLTPSQLIIKTRIDAARRLLATGHGSVAAIAQACGYCDQSAFTRQFRKVVGLTPVEYRSRFATAPGAG